MEKFTIGVVLGGLGGALLVANSFKTRMLVKKCQDDVKARVDEMMDEKINALDKKAKQIDGESATAKDSKK